jgi:hypothetical protein
MGGVRGAVEGGGWGVVTDCAGLTWTDQTLNPEPIEAVV